MTPLHVILPNTGSHKGGTVIEKGRLSAGRLRLATDLRIEPDEKRGKEHG
jgi:hypothetical protein